MLNRGEIAMGPVWVDMFYTWQADGKLPPEHAPAAHLAGHAGPADVLRDSGQGGACRGGARSSSRFATSPAMQAEGIVKRFNWYPGIDAQHVQAHLDRAAWEKLFTDVSPQDLSAKGKPFPIGDYFKEIQEAYERQVAN